MCVKATETLNLVIERIKDFSSQICRIIPSKQKSFARLLRFEVHDINYYARLLRFEVHDINYYARLLRFEVHDINYYVLKRHNFHGYVMKKSSQILLKENSQINFKINLLQLSLQISSSFCKYGTTSNCISRSNSQNEFFD